MVIYKRHRLCKGWKIGDDGSIWSKKSGYWKQLKPFPVNKWGHLAVDYTGSRTLRKVFLVHRLVLEVFIGPCPNGQEGCHRDGNPSNNKLTNLRWGTHGSNEKDKLEHGTSPRGKPRGDMRGELHYGSKLKEHDVKAIKKRLRQNEPVGLIAKDYPVSASAIHFIKNGTTWSWVK